MSATHQVCCISTDTVCKAVNGAIDTLRDTAAIVNGYGILFDVSQTKYALAHAKSLIEQAQKAIAETQWPTNADYDRWGL